MPEFPEDGSLDAAAFDFMHLIGIMSYPRDVDAQAQILESIQAGQAKEALAFVHGRYGKTHEINVPADFTLWLADAPDRQTTLEAAVSRAGTFGPFAGLILGWIIFSAAGAETRQQASLHNAFRMIEEGCKLAKRSGGGFVNLQKNVWPEFRPAAHLWAAWHLWTDPDRKAVSVADLSLLLRMAEWFRRKGEALKPQRAKVPILFRRETWRIRPEITKSWQKFELACTDLDFWDYRKNYKPPSSKK